VFTGLIDDVGTIASVASTEVGRLMRIRCRYDDLLPGESIACNGACLTVRDCGPGWFDAAAIGSTLSRTTIANWIPGKRLNLERAMRFDGRFGGHLVQGHVDGVAIVTARRQRGDYLEVQLALPPEVAELTVTHGSIAVDGVSLTVNGGPTGVDVEVALIDHTVRHTSLGDLGQGDAAHVEADLIGKYVQRLLLPHLAPYLDSTGAVQSRKGIST
jgi:riboflavin synthase